MTMWTVVFSTLALLLGGATTGTAAEKRVGDAYPLTTCPVSGQKLGSMGDPVVHLHEGREVRFCCKGCVGKFNKEPERFLKEIDAKIVAEQADAYPLKTCLISGEKLEGDMEPVDIVVGNRLVRLCCKGCVRDVKKDVAGTLAKLDKAVVEQQKESYPLKTCVISGEDLGKMGGAVDFVFAGRLVRFCCKGCTAKFEKDPGTALAKLDEAREAAAKRETKDDSGREDGPSKPDEGGHGKHHDGD